MKLRFLILVLLIVFLPNSSDAKVYKWRDDNGKLHFTDSIDKIPPQYRKNLPREKRKKKTAEQNHKQSAGKKDAPARDSEVATNKTTFFLMSEKGRKVKIYDFDFGYWKKTKGFEIPKKITLPRDGVLPIKEGGEIGAFFIIREIKRGDAFQITMRIKAPLAGGQNAMQEGSSVVSLSGNYKKEMKTITLDADQRFSKDFQIPGDFTFQFLNNGKVFRSQNIRIVWADQ